MRGGDGRRKGAGHQERPSCQALPPSGIFSNLQLSMTEQEIIARQGDGSECYLLQVGMFVHAYEGAAFAMARLTGYKVRRVHRKAGDIHMLGFSASQLDSVSKRLQQAGVTVRQQGEGLWTFAGGDTTVDESLIAAGKPASARADKAGITPSAQTLLDEVLGYNLAASTPMAAMLFLSDLQQRYGKK